MGIEAEGRPARGGEQRSVQMLRDVLDGDTFAAIAIRHGIARTTVERRVKRILNRLVDEVGVEGLRRGLVSIRRVRMAARAVEEALQSFEPDRPASAKRPRVYSDAEIASASLRVRARGTLGARDAAMFLLLIVAGARPLEVARLKVSDYLEPSGEVRRVSQWRAEVSVSGRTRPLYFGSGRLISCLDEYLALRIARSWGCGLEDAYRGLEPDSMLFLDDGGAAFEIVATGTGGQRRYLCRGVLAAYRRIFRNAELPGATPLSVRTTLADRLYARGAEEDQVGSLLGIESLRVVRQKFPRPRRRLEELAANLF